MHARLMWITKATGLRLLASEVLAAQWRKPAAIAKVSAKIIQAEAQRNSVARVCEHHRCNGVDNSLDQSDRTWFAVIPHSFNMQYSVLGVCYATCAHLKDMLI